MFVHAKYYMFWYFAVIKYKMYVFEIDKDKQF